MLPAFLDTPRPAPLSFERVNRPVATRTRAAEEPGFYVCLRGWLYWNVGRVITEDIQHNVKRARYGEQLLQNLGAVLRARYGEGFSLRNLRDMRRFFECFDIRQPVATESVRGHIPPSPLAESSKSKICSALPGKSSTTQIPPPLVAKTSDIFQPPPRPVRQRQRCTSTPAQRHRPGYPHP